MALPTDSTAHAGVAGAPYPMSLGGRPYLLDLSRDSGFVERSIPLLKPQTDDSGNVAESSLNPEDLIRRGMETWHHGMGQRHRDRAESNPARYSTSHYIDPWEKWQATLLWDTKSIGSLTSNANRENSLASVGSYLYLIDGEDVKFTDDDLDGSVSWDTATGTPSATAEYLATDGFNVFVAFGSNGVYTCEAGDAALTQLFSSTCGYLWYVKGRLLATNGGGVLYNPTDFSSPPNTFPDALLDLGSTWLWDCAAEGTSHIYIGGYRTDGAGRGDHSAIYKTAVKPDGTALDVPTVAATLPDGERITGMCGYLGFVVIGVQNVDTVAASVGRSGVRLAQIQSDGNLVLGPKIDVDGSVVYAFEPQDRFVWFTWWRSSTSSGIGRLDLSEFTGDLQPAYARDLSYTGTNLGPVRAIATHQGRRVFRIDDDVVACEDFTSRREAGNIYLGQITYGLPDKKVGMFVDVALATSGEEYGTAEVWVSTDGTNYTYYPPQLSASGTVDLSALEAETFWLQIVLRRGTTVTNSPVLSRVTMRSFIAAKRTREFVIPVILRPRLTVGGMDVSLDTAAEVEAIAAMVGTVQVLKIGTRTEHVQVKDYQWTVDYIDEETGMMGGLCHLKCQVVA